MGWLEGCRKIIGFDGCFLKGACKGELLVAIEKNGNNQMYPIAWAVVDQETKHSWSWVINYLILDLQLGDGEGLTVMSDMQKGLVPTIRELLPNSEHRMCARHIWSNWSKKWRGEERRIQFWRCAKSSYEVKFKEEMIALEKLVGKKICEDLLHYRKEGWCKAYFKEHAKCDVVENNMCETFNSWILAPRHKSVITMLEDIRHKIMNRQADMINFSNTWISDISPMARAILEENKLLSRKCKVIWNAHTGFEIMDGVHRMTVDLRNQTCSCRTWRLRGIPCAHAICAFYHLNKQPEDYVEHWYRKDTFLKAYNYFIQPIPNMKMWSESTNPPIEPPAPKAMPGRPKRCRRKAKNEPRKKCGKLSKKGVKMTCSKCHQVGHTKKACQVVTGMGMPTQPGNFSQTTEPNTWQESAPSSSSQPAYTTPPSVCDDTTAVRRVNETQPTGTVRGRGRGIGRGRGRPLQTSFGTAIGGGVNAATGLGNGPVVTSGRGDGSATESVPRGGFSGQKRGRDNSEFVGAQKRPRNVGFGLYTDHRTGSQILNPGTSSERFVMGDRNMKDASATNIDIGFKPRKLQWKGREAVTISQLQSMAAAKKSSSSIDKWLS